MAVTFVDDGNAAINLSGATLALIIHNTQTNTDTAGAGAWTITNAAGGLATYAWASADSATPGTYLLYIKATYGGGGVAFADPIPWQVNAT
jgi:predicted alpha/beta superfamily hydrolase